MKTLFFSQYFPPEMGAPAARVSELAACWARLGEQVTVITTFPNHPTGVVPEEYRGKMFQREGIDGYTVLRSWIYVAANKGFLKRVICFLSYMLSAALVGALRAGSCDVVIATSPQIFAGFAGWAVSLLKRKPFVLEVRDLWPDSAIQLEVLKNPLLIKCSKAMELFLYRRADLIVPVSESIREAILGHGIPAERIELIPNGIQPDLFDPEERANAKREQLGVGPEDFLVSYIGTHGMAHGLERLVEAANLLRDEPRLRFVFIGDGAHKEGLVRMSHEMKIPKLTFLPPQPKIEVPLWLAASDLSVVSLRNLLVFRTVLPSKMFEIMAAGRPVLLAGEGECARLLERAKAGVTVPTGEPRDLADAILALSMVPGRRKEYGERGRAYVTENFDRGRLAERYLNRLITEFAPPPSS